MGTDTPTEAIVQKGKMMDEQTARYAESLARLIRLETVSGPDTSGDIKFHAFREVLKEMRPAVSGLTAPFPVKSRKAGSGAAARWTTKAACGPCSRRRTN